MHDLTELVADVRRRLRMAEDERARSIADLPDSDLVWLLANGWEPPAPRPVRRTAATVDAFVLTVEQYEAYQRTVREAQEIKVRLQLAEAHRSLSSMDRSEVEVALRYELRLKAERLQSMAEEWERG